MTQDSKITPPDSDLREGADSIPTRQQAEDVANEAQANDRLVPVSEAKKYRKRAQAAEKILEDLKQEITEKNLRLQENEQLINDMVHRQLIDELLIDSQAIDLDATRLLTELALAEMEEPDIEQAVADLRNRKPLLFRATQEIAASLGPKGQTLEPQQPRLLEQAATEAHSTGSRTALMRYLRLRRQK